MGSWRLGPSAQSFPYYHRWFFRTGEQRRLRVPGPAARARSRSTRGSASATWTSRRPARTCPASTTPPRRHPEARRRAAQPPGEVPPRASPDEYETLGRSVPAAAPESSLASVDQPGRRLPDGRRGEPGPDHHPAAVRPLARADAARCSTTATARRPAGRQLGAPAEPRSALPCAAGFGTRVVQDQQEEFMDAAGSRSATCWRPTPDPARAVRPAGLRHLVRPAPRAGRSVSAGQQGAAAHGAGQRAGAARAAPRCTTRTLESLVAAGDDVGVAAPRSRPRGRLVRSLPFDATHAPAS